QHPQHPHHPVLGPHGRRGGDHVWLTSASTPDAIGRNTASDTAPRTGAASCVVRTWTHHGAEPSPSKTCSGPRSTRPRPAGSGPQERARKGTETSGSTRRCNGRTESPTNGRTARS